MKLIRKILSVPFSLIAVIAFVGVFLLLFPLLLLLTLVDTKWSHNGVQILNGLWAVIISLTVFSPHFTRNRKAVKGRGPYIYTANHSSYWDIPVCVMTLPTQFRFVGKAELNKVPLFGYIFRRVQIPVNRGNRIEAVRSLEIAKKKLAEGTSILIFPEGTIPDKRVTLGSFKDGAFRLAVETGVPLVPVTILNAATLLPDAKPMLVQPFTRVTTIFDEPIPTLGLSSEDVPALREKVFGLLHGHLTQK